MRSWIASLSVLKCSIWRAELSRNSSPTTKTVKLHYKPAAPFFNATWICAGVCLPNLKTARLVHHFSAFLVHFQTGVTNGLTQAELAEKTGLSDNFIGLIERGIKHPTLETLDKIASALEVDLSAVPSSPLLMGRRTLRRL